jgi:hypothetical protein
MERYKCDPTSNPMIGNPYLRCLFVLKGRNRFEIFPRMELNADITHFYFSPKFHVFQSKNGEVQSVVVVIFNARTSKNYLGTGLSKKYKSFPKFDL